MVPVCAAAQVSVNHAALMQLAGIAPTPPAAAAPPPVVHHIRHRPKVVVAVAKPVPPPALAVLAPLPALPSAPPETPAQAAKGLSKAFFAPVPPIAVAQPPVHVVPASVALTLHFADGSAALPEDAGAALKPFCTAHGVIGIDAYAPANPEDPSSAMRLSMSRAFAVRDALSACGLPMQQMLPRAMGGSTSPDENTTEITAGPAK